MSPKRHTPSARYPDVTGALLAGGRGRRMGTDKVRTPFAGGVTLGEGVLRVLLEMCGEVLVVARPGQRGGTDWPEGVRQVEDREGFPACALAGIHAALEAATHPWVLVMAADLPFPSPSLAAGLIETARADGTPAVVAPCAGGVVHPLVAVYHRSLAGEISRRMAAGELRVQALARAHGLLVPEETLRRWDPQLAGLVNVNTPEELAAARARLARGGYA